MLSPSQTLDEYNANKVFRWPDGSLRREKPPAKREVALARREWEDIVSYCRRTGGCPHCTEQGLCLRHGFGVRCGRLCVLPPLSLSPSLPFSGRFPFE